MRTREIINIEYRNTGTEKSFIEIDKKHRLDLILEVLLDIRELLLKQDNTKEEL